MALRRFLLICVLCCAAHGGVKRFTLDDRASYAIAIGTEAPTTVLFPGPIEAIDSANLSSRSEDRPPALIAHAPNARYFTVRSLASDSRAAANILFGGRLYALTFSNSETPDRTVTFEERGSTQIPQPVPRSPARWLALLDRAKAHSELAARLPGSVQGVELRTLNIECPISDRFCARIVEAVTFALDGAIAARVRLENGSAATRSFRPHALLLYSGETALGCALTDAPIHVRAQTAVECWVVAGTETSTPPDLASLRIGYAAP